MEYFSVLGLANLELGELMIELALIIGFYANLTDYYSMLLALPLAHPAFSLAVGLCSR